jgi:hypothetical protein
MSSNEQQTRSRTTKLPRVLIAFLIIAPLATIGLFAAGILTVMPLRRVGEMPTPVIVVERMDGSVTMIEEASPSALMGSGGDRTFISAESTSSSTDIAVVEELPWSFLAPDDGKIVFAAFGIAALAVLLGAVAFRLITHRWEPRDARAGRKSLAVRYAIVALVLWIAIGGFLLADLVYAVSVYSRVLLVFAGLVLLLAIVTLLGRPTREKALVIVLALLIVFSIPFANWNSRKTFLRSLYRIQEGMTLDQVEAIMSGYRKGDVSPIVAETGPSSGTREAETTATRSYRHTTEGWGDSDFGVVTFENGRVVDVDFLPD